MKKKKANLSTYKKETMNILISILNESWKMSLEMAPYLLLGFIVAGFLHVFIPIDLISKHLGKDSFSSIIKASLFGIPIPLCSCGVLPVAASLRKNGASKSATLSFLITTPVTGVDSLLATYGLLGWIFTVFRLISSIIIGFFTGYFMSFDFRKNRSIPIKEIEGTCTDSSCTNPQTSENIENNNFSDTLLKKVSNYTKDIIHYAFVELPEPFSGSLLFGLLLAGIIAYLLPPGLIKENIGTGFLGIILSTVIAIPLYVCATGSIPIAAVMVATGFSPGAAMAFLIAGPATNSVAILTVKKILGKKALVVYLTFIFFGAIGFGVILDLLNVTFYIGSIIPHLNSSPSIFKIISAIILLAIIVPLFLKSKYNKYFNKIKIKDNSSMNSIILETPEISCQHCVASIKKTLSQFENINEIQIDIKTKKVMITSEKEIDINGILKKLDESGYPSTIK